MKWRDVQRGRTASDHRRRERQVPIHLLLGGTSAGLAIQGEFACSAQGYKPDGPDLYSPLALADPWNPQVTIARGFLDIPPLKGTITDAHFGKRDRMGRLLVFMARILDSGAVTAVKGIASTNTPQYCLSPMARAASWARVLLISCALKKTRDLQERRAPHLQQYFCERLKASDKFDLTDWQGGGVSYELSVCAAKVRSSQSGGGIY